jgi:hypothetical protein
VKLLLPVSLAIQELVDIQDLENLAFLVIVVILVLQVAVVILVLVDILESLVIQANQELAAIAVILEFRDTVDLENQAFLDILVRLDIQGKVAHLVTVAILVLQDIQVSPERQATLVNLELVDILAKAAFLVTQVLANLVPVDILENLEHQVTVDKVVYLAIQVKVELQVIQDKVVFQVTQVLVNLALLVIQALVNQGLLDTLEIVVLAAIRGLVILVQVVTQALADIRDKAAQVDTQVKVELLDIQVNLA